MNVQRFTGRTSRDAMLKLRQALGDDAVVLSTKPCDEGIEMLAMAPHALAAVEQRMSSSRAPARQPAPAPAPERGRAAARQPAQAARAEVAEDADQLQMSTLSFQDYVRERMLRKREAALRGPGHEPAAARPTPTAGRAAAAAVSAANAAGRAPMIEPVMGGHEGPDSGYEPVDVRMARRNVPATEIAADRYEAPVRREPAPAPSARDAQRESHRAAAHDGHRDGPRELRHEAPRAPVMDSLHAVRDVQADAAMLSELRSMKGLIEERFGALAFMEKLQRQPTQARLTQKLLDCGFSPMLIRKLVDGLGADVIDEQAWVANILERNLVSGENEPALEDQGGVFAMIGSTGVGKTTSTAKLAAAFATKHGAANLGLVTLDAYRLGAHEQLRAYGRILGVPVHTAHDRTALEDLLDLLSAKKMVLIDTAGVAQRDARTRDLLEMLSHRSINKLLVINAAAQGETIDDVLVSYRAAACKGIVLSKLDEAVKLGPALDALIRHKLKVLAIANGQRVPEDWHRLSGHALVHRALRAAGSAAYKFDASDVNLVFSASPAPARSGNAAGAH